MTFYFENFDHWFMADGVIFNIRSMIGFQCLLAIYVGHIKWLKGTF